jgi:hypothetical protein
MTVLGNPAKLDARRFAALGAVPGCGVARTLVDVDGILSGTEYDVGFGQSPAAISMGAVFERACEGPTGSFAPLLASLAEAGVDPGTPAVIRFPESSDPAAMYRRTRKVLRNILGGGESLLVVQPTFALIFGGQSSYLRPDALLLVRIEGRMMIVELKGFRIRDGYWPGDKVATALDQSAVYQLVVRRVVADMAFDPEIVDERVAIVCASGLGLSPRASIQNNRPRRLTLERRVAAAEAALADGPDVGLFSEGLLARDPLVRLATFESLVRSVGTNYISACVGICGGFAWCRSHAVDDPARIGQPVVIGAVGSIRRSVALADGDAPKTADEVAAARVLTDARSLELAAESRRRAS